MNRSGLIFVVSMLVLATLSSGCATYRHRIAEDMRDSIKLNAGVGLGIHARVKATSLVDAGVGWGGGWWSAGMESRYTPFLHPSMEGCLFPLGVIPGLIPDVSPMAGLRMASTRLTVRSDFTNADYVVVGQLLDVRAMSQWSAYGPSKRSVHSIFKPGELSYTEQPLGFEASVGLLLVTLKAGFDPVEFFDLLCTMSGWDLLKDNP